MSDTLYMSEPAIAKKLGIPLKDWQRVSVSFERKGLPQPCPTLKLRYWPAVLAWLDSYYGVVTTRHTAPPIATVPDGEVNHDAFKTNYRRTRA